MQKLLIISVVSIALASAAMAQDKPGVSDLDEPRPPAKVTATNVASVVTTKTEKDGAIINESEAVLFKEPTSVANMNTPESVLPPAKIIDSNLDLEQTMEIMGRHFKALKQAGNTQDMREPVEQLMKLASQAQALGGGMHEAKRVDYEMGIKQLRINLAELAASVQENDFSEATALIERIDENRRQSHDYFGVE